MAFYNRREFLQATTASAYFLGTLKLDGAPSAPARIQESGKSVRVQGTNYAWEWSPDSDKFRLLDRWGMVIASGKLQPAVLVQPEGKPGSLLCTCGKPASHEIHGNQLNIHYIEVNGSAELFTSWKFDANGFWSAPAEYVTST